MKFRDHLQDKIVVYDCLLRCIINLLESFSSNAALVGESKAEIGFQTTLFTSERTIACDNSLV